MLFSKCNIGITQGAIRLKNLFDGGYWAMTPYLHSELNGVIIIARYANTFHYYVRDYQGNNRVVVNDSCQVEQTNDYYAYGGPWGDTSTNQGFQPFKYNGKELDRIHGLDWYDYGARRYDPACAQFTQMDPLCEQYPHLSPYAYCAGNPVNAIDPDGRLIVFINGFHNGFEGASPKYWSKGFDTAIMSHFQDNHAIYIDGSLGGVFGLNKNLVLSNMNPQIRYMAGLSNGMTDAESIIAGLMRDTNGNIIENIILITHSMGGAYGKGYAQALVNYIKSHPTITSGIKISEYDFAPFEPTMQKAITGVDTYQ